MLRFLKIAAPLLCAGIATAASAAGTGSAGVRVQAIVPEVCEVHLSGSLMATDGTIASAEVFEMCNSMRGFQVVALHRALDENETVQVNYGGTVNELEKSGVSSLAFRQGPALRTVPITVQSTGLESALVISVGMAAI